MDIAIFTLVKSLRIMSNGQAKESSQAMFKAKSRGLNVF